jgi:DUF1680 family protein
MINAEPLPTAEASTAPIPREKLKLFSYHDVTLTAGPLKEQFDRSHAFLASLDVDRVLKVYRQHAGLPAPGADMGGWYDPTGFAPGHSFGQWLSAISRTADATGDPTLKDKARKLVEGFGATIRPDRPFYAAYRFPAYTFDKQVIGLMDAYRFAGVESAPDVLRRATDGVLPSLPEKALTRDEMAKRPHKDISFTWDEHYTMPENLFIAHELTGDARYLELAKRFLHDKPYFDPLSRGENVLPGLHAYSHMNALSSAARAYLVLGDEKYLKAIKNAWDMIETTQQFASGGWGPNEAFVEPGKGKLGDSLNTTRNHFETPCGAYAHFKLARYLMRITGESRYGDSLERVLYNTILAAKDLKSDGTAFYYSDYQAKAAKRYHPDKWPCCSGTFPQVIADYLISMYFHGDEGIYVNLYAPSIVRWKRGDTPVTLTQTTDYPDTGKVTLSIKTDRPEEFTIFLRIPKWADSNVQIAVNDQTVAAPAKPGTFAAIRRRWGGNDTVSLTLPLTYRTEPVDDHHPDTVAVMRGPVMLVTTGTESKLRGDSVKAANAKDAAAPLVVGERPLMPFYKVGDELYTTYFTRT